MAFLLPVAAEAAATAAAGSAAAASAASIGATLSTIGTIASIASAGIGAVGAIKQAQAQSASAKYNAEVQQNNAQIANQNATWTAQEGEQQVAMQQQKTRSEVGAIKAAQAASGVDVNNGSAVDVQSSAAATGQLNAITLRSNAVRKAYGFQTQSSSDTGQAQLDESQAKNDTTAGEVGAGSTVLGGLGSASLNYANYLKSGGLTTGSSSNDLLNGVGYAGG